MKKEHDFWGGIFDFNGDGKTSLDEEILGLHFVQMALKEEEERQQQRIDDELNLLDSPDYVDPEVEAQLIQTAKEEAKANTKEECLSSSPKAQQQSRASRYVIGGLALLIVVVAAIGGGVHLYRNHQFNSGLSLIQEEQFAEAEAVFQNLYRVGNEDAYPLRQYCKAYQFYRNGEYINADEALNQYSRDALKEMGLPGYQGFCEELQLRLSHK